MYKKIFILTIMVTICLQSLFANDLPIKNQDISPQQLQKQNKQVVQLAANELSKNLPQKVDKYTNFTAIKANGTTLIYTFEINITPRSDEDVKKNDYTRMKRNVTKGICSSSKRFLDAQISISYIYLNAITKTKLFQFDIDKNDCL